MRYEANAAELHALSSAGASGTPRDQPWSKRAAAHCPASVSRGRRPHACRRPRSRCVSGTRGRRNDPRVAHTAVGHRPRLRHTSFASPAPPMPRTWASRSLLTGRGRARVWLMHLVFCCLSVTGLARKEREAHRLRSASRTVHRRGWTVRSRRQWRISANRSHMRPRAPGRWRAGEDFCRQPVGSEAMRS